MSAILPLDHIRPFGMAQCLGLEEGAERNDLPAALAGFVDRMGGERLADTLPRSASGTPVWSMMMREGEVRE